MSQPVQQSTNPLRTLQNLFSPKNNETNFSELSLPNKLLALNKSKIHSLVDLENFYEKLIIVIDCITNEFFFLNRDNRINFFESISVFMDVNNPSCSAIDFNSILKDENVSLLFRKNLGYFREKNKPEIRQTLSKPIFINTTTNWDVKLIEHVQLLQNNLKKTLEISNENSSHNHFNSPLYLLPIELYFGSIFSHLDLSSLLNLGKSSYYFSRVVDCFLIKVTQSRTTKLNFKQLLSYNAVETQLMIFFTNTNYFNEFEIYFNEVNYGNESLNNKLSEKVKKYEEIFQTFVEVYDVLSDSTKLQAWKFATNCADKSIGFSGNTRKIGCSINDCLGLFIPFILQREFGFKSQENKAKKNTNSFLKNEHLKEFYLVIKHWLNVYNFVSMKTWHLSFYNAKEGEKIYPNYPVFNNSMAFNEYSDFLEILI